MAASPDPKKLFDAEFEYERPLLSQVIAPLACSVTAVACVCVANYSTLRPVLSGIQKHITWGLAAGILGKVGDDWRRDYYAERDAIIRHYIKIHPDDFPTPERQKLKEMFKPWLAVR